MKIVSNFPSCELYFKHIILEVFSSDFIKHNPDSFELYISENKDSIEAKVTFKTFTVISTQAFSDHSTKNIARTCAIGHSVIQIGKILGFSAPPYGVLTGVRPIKVALECTTLSNFAQFEKELFQKYMVVTDKSELLYSAMQYDKIVRNNHMQNDISLYFSIPFCPSRCNYCSFVSSSIEKKWGLIPEYLNALFNEMKLVSDVVKKHSLNVKSVYVGGGTPGVLNECQLNEFFTTFNACFGNHSLSEFTFEIGRPETVTREKLSILLHNGVNRISINTQTTNDGILQRIGRNHTSYDYFKSIELAKSFNFKSINTDIIAGLDGESLESFKKSIEDVISTGVNNVTVHALCIKKSARIKNTEFPNKLHEEINDFIHFSKNYCIKSSFAPYYLYRQKYSLGNHESVGYCKDDTYSHYNIAMMNEVETVIGLGAGATSRVISETGSKHFHFENYKYPNEYVKDPTKTASEILLIDKALTNLSI